VAARLLFARVANYPVIQGCCGVNSQRVSSARVGIPCGQRVAVARVVSYPVVSVIPVAGNFVSLVLGDPVAVEAVRYTDRQVHHSHGVVGKSISAEYAQIRAVGVAIVS